jgi:hypothetical protein
MKLMKKQQEKIFALFPKQRGNVVVDNAPLKNGRICGFPQRAFGAQFTFRKT